MYDLQLPEPSRGSTAPCGEKYLSAFEYGIWQPSDCQFHQKSSDWEISFLLAITLGFERPFICWPSRTPQSSMRRPGCREKGNKRKCEGYQNVVHVVMEMVGKFSLKFNLMVLDFSTIK
jgi:hypothetical protein